MKMQNKNTLKISEITLIVLVWVLIIILPMFMNDDESFTLSRFMKHQLVNIPVFFVFIVNRFLLVPRILNKDKRVYYIGSVLGLIAIITLGSYLLQPENPKRPGIQFHQQIPPRQVPPPHVLQKGPQAPPPDPRPVPAFLNILLFSFLLVGFDTGLMTSFRLAKTEKEKAKLEKENIENKLAFLRNQISPHFFMNTLNNIHAQIDIDSEEAKKSIISLSKLMRHILYESEVERIPIKKEMDFISNYVGLMKLRFSEKVKIKLKIPTVLPDVSIPPILFISFIENSFKHGISYNAISFVDIIIKISNNKLNFKISNSKHNNDKKDSSSGIGIANTFNRLELIYKDDYELEITDLKDTYSINLNIPL